MNEKIYSMENQPRPILIPTDFTVVSQYAIEAAAPFAKLNNVEIVLVNIVKEATDIPTATIKVEAEAEKASGDYGIPVKGIVREGSIFTTIGETVNELDANVVFMGTHGFKKGMQKITGSWALKVIVSSKVPIIVVQSKPKKASIDKIVFPIDYKKENREKIASAYFVAKLFNSSFFIIRTKLAKDKKLEQDVRTNLVFTEKFLRSRNMQYEIVVAKGKKSFVKETVQYAEEIDADLILITTTKNISMLDYVVGASEEGIITNSANIPVMCVNPRKKVIGGFSATGG